jgi:hypothetical protein
MSDGLIASELCNALVTNAQISPIVATWRTRAVRLQAELVLSISPTPGYRKTSRRIAQGGLARVTSFHPILDRG